MRTRPTATFFILVSLAAIASFGALVLTYWLNPADKAALQFNNDNNINEVETKENTISDESSSVETKEKSTSDWQQFIDTTHYLSFKHPENWKITTYPDRDGFYIISIKPEKAKDNIRIYVSSNSYLGLEGLPTKTDNIGGIKALNLNDMAFGVRYAAQYYTFTMGTDLSVQKDFKSLLQTVAFSR